MTELPVKTITKHNLKHITQLQLDPNIMQHRFSYSCSMCHCSGACCAEGVLLDLKEKERIIEYSDVIKKYLEKDQEHDSAKWFDHNEEMDIDFPSGRCDGTSVKNGKCVFLDSKGLCALQIAAVSEGKDKYFFKPFYCVAFPLVIDGHVLTTDEPEFLDRSQRCSIVPDGSLTVLDACREEFEYILGIEGLGEIEKIFKNAESPLEKVI